MSKGFGTAKKFKEDVSKTEKVYWDDPIHYRKENLRLENERKGRGDTKSGAPRWQRRGQAHPKRKGRGSRPPFEKHGLSDHIRIFKDERLRESKKKGVRKVKPVEDVRIVRVVLDDGSPGLAFQ